MPALFRIVQDDCPPIPEGASPIVKDFLYHCFQKDCNLRISAKKLLRHPWMVSTRRQIAKGASEPPSGERAARRPLSNYNYDEAVLKVQEWNEALKCTFLPFEFFCVVVSILSSLPLQRPPEYPSTLAAGKRALLDHRRPPDRELTSPLPPSRPPALSPRHLLERWSGRAAPPRT